MCQLAESRFISHDSLTYFFLFTFYLNCVGLYVLQLYVWIITGLDLALYFFICFLKWFLFLLENLFLSQKALSSKMPIRVALEAFLSWLILHFTWLFFLVLAVINWKFCPKYLYLPEPILTKSYLSITSFAFSLLEQSKKAYVGQPYFLLILKAVTPFKF